MRQNSKKAKIGEVYVDNDLVFPTEVGEPTDARNLTRSYKRLLDRHDIAYKKFHALRHTFATRLFERGIPMITVSKLLGHADTSITAEIYTHVLPEQKTKGYRFSSRPVLTESPLGLFLFHSFLLSVTRFTMLFSFGSTPVAPFCQKTKKRPLRFAETLI
jgi:hypothetical protein